MRIQWDTGSTNSYRMGKEGKYDLKLAGPPPVPESSEEEEEDMKGTVAAPLTATSLCNGWDFSSSPCTDPSTINTVIESSLQQPRLYSS